LPNRWRSNPRAASTRAEDARWFESQSPTTPSPPVLPQFREAGLRQRIRERSRENWRPERLALHIHAGGGWLAPAACWPRWRTRREARPRLPGKECAAAGGLLPLRIRTAEARPPGCEWPIDSQGSRA